MAIKSDFKTCRYKYCKHKTRKIDVATDDFVMNGNMYYHRDCYTEKQNEEKRKKKTNADIQLIKNLWVENISNTVNYGQLVGVIGQLLKRGVESEYLVFALKYCIDHKLNLNYPAGFHYFVDKSEIKEAYQQKKNKANKVDINSFVAIDNDNAPKFTVSKKKTGFQNILE